MSCFTSFERFLKSCGIDINLRLTRPSIEKKLPTYLTVDEIFYLLDTVQDQDLPSARPIRDKAIFEVFYATGIRCCGDLRSMHDNGQARTQGHRLQHVTQT